MARCTKCIHWKSEWCEKVIDSPDPDLERDCRHFSQKTRADHIRSMSDEELANRLVDIGWDCHCCSEHWWLDNEPLLREDTCDEKCRKHAVEWLQQPWDGE